MFLKRANKIISEKDTLDSVLKKAVGFVGQPIFEENGSLKVDHGFVRASHIGTGAMLIQRSVIETMCVKYPELKGRGFPNESENLNRFEHCWGFFNPIHNPNHDGQASEDVSFCYRWLDCGGEIWANISSESAHIGRHQFKGAYIDQFDKNEITESPD